MASRIPTHKSTPGVESATSLSPHDPAIQQAKHELEAHGTLLDVTAPKGASHAQGDASETQPLLSHSHQGQGEQQQQQQPKEGPATQVASVGKKIDQGHAQSGDPDVAGAADIDD